MLTMYPANIAQATVSASGAKSFFARPNSSKTGRSTATVVRVAASAGTATASVPSLAAVAGFPEAWSRRCTDSSTTTEMSTSGPMESVSPPRVKALSVFPVA